MHSSNFLTRQRHKRGDRGAALFIAIVLLVALTIVAVTTYTQSRRGLKQSGMQKKSVQTRQQAEDAMNRVIDLIINWFGNSSAGNQQYVFPKDVSQEKWTYLGSDDHPEGHYAYIPWDTSQERLNEMIDELLRDFARLFNSVSSYPPALSGASEWRNTDDDNIAHGVFYVRKSADGKLTTRVWAEGLDRNGADCAPAGTGNHNVACIEPTTYRGSTVSALKLKLHSRSGTTHMSRSLWLIPVQSSLVDMAWVNGKTSECTLCHVNLYGSAAQTGDMPIRPLSHHMAHGEVTGSLFLKSTFDLNNWPFKGAEKRFVNCSDADHAPHCQTHPLFGPYVERLRGPEDQAESYALDHQPYNGTFKVGVHNGENTGDIFEGVDDVEKLPTTDMLKQAMLRDLENMPASKVTDFKPSWDPGGDPDDYLTNKFVDIKDQYKKRLEQAGEKSFIKGTGDHEILFSTGKPYKAGKHTDDPFAERGLIRDMKVFSSTATGTNPTIAPGFEHTFTSKVLQEEEGKDVSGTIKLPDEDTGLVLEGNVFLRGALKVCGVIYVMGDAMFDDVEYDTSGCEQDNSTIYVAGNTYAFGDVTGKGNPNLQDENDIPAGPAYTVEEMDTKWPNRSTLNIVTTNFIGNNPNSVHARAMVIPTNTEINAMVADLSASPPLSGTKAYLNDGKKNPDVEFEDGSVTPAVLGFTPWDNDHPDGRLPRQEPFALEFKPSPDPTVESGPDDPYKGIHVRSDYLASIGWQILGSGLEPGEDYPVGGWFDAKELDKQIFAGGPTPAGPGAGIEDPEYGNGPHQLHLNIVAEKVMQINMTGEGTAAIEGLPWDLTDPIQPWTQNEGKVDSNGNGLSFLGVVMALENFLLNPGGLFMFANPDNINNSIVNPLGRVGVASKPVFIAP